MTLIEARQVSKIYRRGKAAALRAVDDVSLTVEPGSCCAITGRSGSGKSTMLALLGGLERPTSGEILFGGKSLAVLSDIGLAAVRRQIGFVFQNFALMPKLAVWENISYPLVPRGVRRRERMAAAGDLLEQFGLAERMFEPSGMLSGGEQQRLAIARALIGQPEVVFADEPTNQLDEQSSQAVLEAFRRMTADGRTLVIATHDERLVALATQVAKLDAGRLVPPGNNASFAP